MMSYCLDGIKTKPSKKYMDMGLMILLRGTDWILAKQAVNYCEI